MNYVVKYGNVIFASTLLWVIYRLAFVNPQNKVIDAYFAGSVFVAMLFLLIIALERQVKLPVMRKLLIVSLLVTAFQIIGLMKLYETPAGLAKMLPSWFSWLTSIVALLVNFIIYLICDTLARRGR